MSRIIEVTDNISIVYNFPNKQYEITNKKTTTARTTIADTLEVLSILHPSMQDIHGNLITRDTLQALADTLEPLTSLSYTLSDKGDYVSTIQINTYEKNPLTLDLDKQKLYIMNSNIIFDLTLNEGREHRVSAIKDYYKRHLGIDLISKDLTILYDLLLSYNKPHPYNLIPMLTDSKETIKYSTTINFSNPNNLSKVTYSLLTNPNSLYNTPTKYYIDKINANKVLALTTTPTTLSIGDEIIIDNTEVQVTEDSSYSSNGTYHVTAIDLDKKYIKVKEQLAQFNTKYLQCYLKQPLLQVESVDRNSKTITTHTTVPDSILLGDTIYLEGTSKYINFQDVSVDGSYTVYSIDNKSIVVEDYPLTNYMHDTDYATLSKHVELGDVLSISNKVVTLSKEVPTGIEGLYIVIDNKTYTVDSITTNTITVTEDIEDYTPNYGELKVAEPVEEVEVDILTSNKDALPKGQFILDTYEETIQYLKLGIREEYVPTLTNFQRVGKVLEQEMHLEECSVDTMHLIGLYSQKYGG